MINELTSLNRSLMLSIDIIPVPTDEAVREMQNRLLGVETNVTNWQRRQNANNNFSAVVPYDLEQQRKETREMLDDLTTRDQRMMFAVVTLVHLADSKEELDSDTETLQSIARKHLCQLTTLNWQQADGLVTALPLGLRRIDALRTLTTEALAVLMPFKAQEIWDRGGVYYGQNAISKISSWRTAGSFSTATHSFWASPAPANPSAPRRRWCHWRCPRRTISSSSIRSRSTAPSSKDWAVRSSTSPPPHPTISTPWIWSRAMGTEKTPWC